ncbi:MAG: hypothetical protein ICV60_23220 [Pyrinomonadaceae bacterium]|nr:hypothetical protein [Pyrinomonadaceae bacterium]
MEHRDLFGEMNKIIKEMKRLNDAHPEGLDEESNRRVSELLEEGRKIGAELDPVMRDFYRNDPVRLAAWEDIMQVCSDEDEEEEE